MLSGHLALHPPLLTALVQECHRKFGEAVWSQCIGCLLAMRWMRFSNASQDWVLAMHWMLVSNASQDLVVTMRWMLVSKALDAC